MSRRHVKTTTAIALCAALGLPAGVHAQGDSLFRIGPDDRIEPNAGALNERPCEVLGALRAEVPDRLGPAATEPSDLSGLSPEACREVIASALSDGAPAEAAGEGAAQAEVAAPEAAASAEAEGAQQGEVPEVAEAPEVEAPEVAEVPEPDTPAEAPEVAEAREAAPAAEAPDVAEALEPAPAEEEAEGEAVAETPPEALAEAPEQPDMAAAPEAAPNSATAGDDVAEAPGAPADETAGGGTVDDERADAEAPPEPRPEVRQQDTAASAARASAVPEAADALEAVEALEEGTDTVREDADVVREVVTEETARTSGEEFATALQAPAAEQTAQDGDRRSALETLAIGTLGGTLLGNILTQGDDVVAQSQDRVVVRRDDGDLYVVKDDNTLLRRPGSTVETRRFDDGSTVETITRPDGTRIVTVRAADGQVLRRTKVLADGERVTLIDDTQGAEPVDIARLPEVEERMLSLEDLEGEALRRALLAEEARRIDRGFTLRQIREIRAVRNLVPVLDVEAVTFDSGSAVVRASEAEELSDLAYAMRSVIEENPSEVFLIEGHTDAVGGAAMNLALSDRRAESVALALTEYFDVPPENMVIQGFGESNLRVQTQGPERENRRVTVRRITPLLERRT